jgi:hypothetical protein
LNALSSQIVSQKLVQNSYLIQAVQATHCKLIDTAGGSYYKFLKKHGVDPRSEYEQLCAEFGLDERVSYLGEDHDLPCQMPVG